MYELTTNCPVTIIINMFLLGAKKQGFFTCKMLIYHTYKYKSDMYIVLMYIIDTVVP
jgi:hypothetical protein